MQIDPELYKQIKEAIDNFPPYPDPDALIANGDLKKVRGGYNVLSEAGMEAIKRYIISVLPPHNGKPAVFRLSRKTKSQFGTYYKELTMQLTVELVKADDDLPPRDQSLQKDFSAFASELKAANIQVSQRSMAFDSVSSLGYPLGEFILKFTIAIQPVLVVAVKHWFDSRKGRKVRFNINGTEIEANDIKEMEKLIELTESIREGRPSQGDREPHDPDVGR